MVTAIGLHLRKPAARSIRPRSRATSYVVRPPLRCPTLPGASASPNNSFNMDNSRGAPSGWKLPTPSDIGKGISGGFHAVLGLFAGFLLRLWNSMIKRLPHFAQILYAFVLKAAEAAITRVQDLPVPQRRLPDLTPFLKLCDVKEVEHTRKMSTLCALSYKPWQLNKESLQRRLRMKYINSSYDIKAAEEKKKAAAKALLEVAPKRKRDKAREKVSELVSKSIPALGSTWMDDEDYLGFEFLEWFTADEPVSNMRYFVVMGSDTMEHWRLNLTLDPVTFEDPKLGVKIHSGVYEAAEALYERFFPSVKQFMAGNPNGRVCFTGHSIGGSMALALMLMFKMRGVLKPENIADTYTFGVPSIFLEGEDCFRRIIGSEEFQKSGAIHDHADSCEFHTHCELCGRGPRGLLEAVGLPETIIRNVLMAYDFVPRAFTCDYNDMAQLLKFMGPGLFDHSLLGSDDHQGRRHLYFYVGKVQIMQADSDLLFTNQDTPHPMLPPEPAMYSVESPNADIKYRPPHTPIPGSRSGSGSGSRAGSSNSPKLVAQSNASFVPLSAAEAVSELMDNPHPMEMFNRPSYTYGANGGISRYHNPENYTRAFGRVWSHMKRVEREKEELQKQQQQQQQQQNGQESESFLGPTLKLASASSS